MKKFCLLLMLLLGGIMFTTAETVPLGVGFDDTTGNIPEHPRTPILVPNVELYIHTLYFNNVGYDLTLVLLDEDGEEAYTTFVPAYTASLFIPLYLNDTYQIRLYPGGYYYFYGWIEL